MISIISRLSIVLVVLHLSLPSFSSHHPSENAGFGQLLLGYFTGVGVDAVGASGFNALSFAFFDPSPMGSHSTCDFTGDDSPCVVAAAGAGPMVKLKWIYDNINKTIEPLIKNTSPSRGQKPTIFISFGGQSAGGSSWNQIFNSDQRATQFAKNCAQLSKTLSAHFQDKVYIGIDLDVEGTSHLSSFSAFISTFRQLAPFESIPLMLCSLSGLASNESSDHFKVAILQAHGPAQKGVNYVNMMVNNVESSCSVMSAFWRHKALDFLPPQSKALGIWGENLQAWQIKNPGCTDGNDPLFPWVKTNRVNIATWEAWLTGSGISTILSQVRAGSKVTKE